MTVAKAARGSPRRRARDALRTAGMAFQRHDLPGSRPPRGQKRCPGRPLRPQGDDAADTTSPSRRCEGFEESAAIRVLRMEFPFPDHQGVRRTTDLHRLRTMSARAAAFSL